MDVMFDEPDGQARGNTQSFLRRSMLGLKPAYAYLRGRGEARRQEDRTIIDQSDAICWPRLTSPKMDTGQKQEEAGAGCGQAQTFVLWCSSRGQATARWELDMAMPVGPPRAQALVRFEVVLHALSTEEQFDSSLCAHGLRFHSRCLLPSYQKAGSREQSARTLMGTRFQPAGGETRLEAAAAGLNSRRHHRSNHWFVPNLIAFPTSERRPGRRQATAEGLSMEQVPETPDLDDTESLEASFSHSYIEWAGWPSEHEAEFQRSSNFPAEVNIRRGMCAVFSLECRTHQLIEQHESLGEWRRQPTKAAKAAGRAGACHDSSRHPAAREQCAVDALCKARRLGSATLEVDVEKWWGQRTLPGTSPTTMGLYIKCIDRYTVLPYTGDSVVDGRSSRTLRRPDRLTGLIQVGDDALQPQFPPAAKCSAANWEPPAQPRLYDNTTLTSLDTTKRSPATKSADKRRELLVSSPTVSRAISPRGPRDAPLVHPTFLLSTVSVSQPVRPLFVFWLAALRSSISRIAFVAVAHLIFARPTRRLTLAAQYVARTDSTSAIWSTCLCLAFRGRQSSKTPTTAHGRTSTSRITPSYFYDRKRLCRIQYFESVAFSQGVPQLPVVNPAARSQQHRSHDIIFADACFHRSAHC
ncbi:hypothetical protein CSOJ01_08130 [Colletotrichum sojae]|uniref:Uncharacterized protein n=1 Tax=Colletotrichum sojae TaxID=2175907 RepID=A0A8H6MTG4_9PEZI|nr:hypothetical protein CSOJ01_08130 [Colletotrichum sojae]